MPTIDGPKSAFNSRATLGRSFGLAPRIIGLAVSGIVLLGICVTTVAKYVLERGAAEAALERVDTNMRVAWDALRATGGNFSIRDGKLYEQSVTILPANGDYATPYASRFVESLIFNVPRVDEEAGMNVPNIQGCGDKIQPFNYK